MKQIKDSQIFPQSQNNICLNTRHNPDTVTHDRSNQEKAPQTWKEESKQAVWLSHVCWMRAALTQTGLASCVTEQADVMTQHSACEGKFSCQTGIKSDMRITLFPVFDEPTCEIPTSFELRGAGGVSDAQVPRHVILQRSHRGKSPHSAAASGRHQQAVRLCSCCRALLGGFTVQVNQVKNTLVLNYNKQRRYSECLRVKERGQHGYKYTVFIVNVIIIVNLVLRVFVFLFPAGIKATFPALTATIKPFRFCRALLHSIVFYPVIALYWHRRSLAQLAG